MATEKVQMITYEVCHPKIDGRTYRLDVNGNQSTIYQCGVCSIIHRNLSTASDADFERDYSLSRMSVMSRKSNTPPPPPPSPRNGKIVLYTMPDTPRAIVRPPFFSRNNSDSKNSAGSTSSAGSKNSAGSTSSNGSDS
jgi:hypothetical protein